MDPQRICLCGANANGRNQRRHEFNHECFKAQQRLISMMQNKHGRGSATAWRRKRARAHASGTTIESYVHDASKTAHTMQYNKSELHSPAGLCITYLPGPGKHFLNAMCLRLLPVRVLVYSRVRERAIAVRHE
eukprot:365709-Chlamydomonas_euryale.AAC.10